jgi:hypothetical protein
MGMGTFGVKSFVIEYDRLKEICPDEIQAIESAKYFDSIGWQYIGRWLGWSDNDQIIDAIHDCVVDDQIFPPMPSDDPTAHRYMHCKSNPVMRLELSEDQIVKDIFDQYEILVTNLKTSFNKKTGLFLYFDYYDEDSGDRYDNTGDKDGCVFCVDGMVQLTPAGEKFKDIIFERSWTQFG